MSESSENTKNWTQGGAYVGGRLFKGAKLTVSKNPDGSYNIKAECEGAVLDLDDQLPALVKVNTERERQKGNGCVGKVIGTIGTAIAIGALIYAIMNMKGCEPKPPIPTTEPSVPTTAYVETIPEHYTVQGSINEYVSARGTLYSTTNPLQLQGIYTENKDAFSEFQTQTERAENAIGKLQEYDCYSELTDEQVGSLSGIAYELSAAYCDQWWTIELANPQKKGDEELIAANLEEKEHQQDLVNNNYHIAEQFYDAAGAVSHAARHEGEAGDTLKPDVDVSIDVEKGGLTHDVWLELEGSIESELNFEGITEEGVVQQILEAINRYESYSGEFNISFSITDEEGKTVDSFYANGTKEEVVAELTEEYNLQVDTQENSTESEPQLGGQRVITKNEMTEVVEKQTGRGLKGALGRLGRLFSRKDEGR